mmetsp:Transcript_52377/g.141223  ORF Transcript_52377/g.141223 Transcript_52377/m.141223 type:complete len:84 (-) Transcript_52377:1166-1417(-)
MLRLQCTQAVQAAQQEMKQGHLSHTREGVTTVSVAKDVRCVKFRKDRLFGSCALAAIRHSSRRRQKHQQAPQHQQVRQSKNFQ